MKKFLTEQQKRQNLAELEIRIAKAFIDNFNKIKRLDEKTVFQGLDNLNVHEFDNHELQGQEDFYNQMSDDANNPIKIGASFKNLRNPQINTVVRIEGDDVFVTSNVTGNREYQWPKDVLLKGIKNGEFELIKNNSF